MSPSIDPQELPKSLRDLIADAKAAVERWHDETDEPEFDNDDIIEAGKDWAVRLSQGDYEADLYWECVAQDCEEAGNWNGAKVAYQKVLSVSQDSFKRSSAYSSLGDLCLILGEQKEALAHYHAASACERGEISNIFCRYRLVREASQLLRMGRVRAARKLSSRGLATIEAENVDYLNLALLKIVVAACELEQREIAKAEELLSAAWAALETLRTNNEQWGTDLGSGVHAAYGRWWRLEAMRHQFEGRADSEIEAWQNSLDHARRAAAGWNRVSRDVFVMRALESLADAYSRNGRVEECTEARAEASKIRDQWHLPAINEPPVVQSTYLSRLWKLLSSRH